MNTHTYLIVLFSFISATTFGEYDGAILLHAVSGSAPGIRGGVSLEELEEDKSNKLGIRMRNVTVGIAVNFKIGDQKKGFKCSGVGINGCVLTAGHCKTDRFIKGEAWATTAGTLVDGNKVNQPLFTFQKAETLGTKVPNDFAVVKVDPPLPEENSLTLEEIADKPYKVDDIRAKDLVDPKKEHELLYVLGYGPSTALPSKVKSWGKDIQRYKNIAEWKRLVGTVLPVSGDAKTIASLPWPNATVAGDSGGPLFSTKKGKLKLEGIATSTKHLDPVDILASKDTKNALSTTYQRHSIVRLEWLKKTLEKLGCAPGKKPVISPARQKVLDWAKKHKGQEFGYNSEEMKDFEKVYKEYLLADKKVKLKKEDFFVYGDLVRYRKNNFEIIMRVATRDSVGDHEIREIIKLGK